MVLIKKRKQQRISHTGKGRIVRRPREHTCQPPRRLMWEEYDILPGDAFICDGCNAEMTAVSVNGNLEWSRDG